MNLSGRSIIGLLTTFIAIFFSCTGVSQGFNYKPIKNTYEKFIKPDIEFTDVKDYLPKGYVKDGSIDYTVYIQKALNENEDVSFPNFPLLIDSKGIRIHDNSNVLFNKKSKLILKPNDKEKYSMIYVVGVKNVNIYNPTLIGDRNQHKGDSGEWGIGIRIQDSDNINILNSNITNTWGDGIYITSYTKKQTNDITIKYGSIDNVRRNGISIISGLNITIDSLQISNTNGHSPAAGIDVEPNKSSDKIENILIKNLFTFNNEQDGIKIDLFELIAENIQNKTEIKILNHNDNNSDLGIRISGHLRNQKKLTPNRLRGFIDIENTGYTNSRLNGGFRIPNDSKYLPKIKLKNIRSDYYTKESLDKYLLKMTEKNINVMYIK